MPTPVPPGAAAPANAPQRSSFVASRALPAVTTTVLVLGAILYLTYVYAPAQREDVRATWRERLQGMAHLRSSGIALYVTESAADAVTVASYPTVHARLEGRDGAALGVVPPGSTTEQHLRVLLDAVTRLKSLRQVLVFRPDGQVAATSTGAVADPACVAVARRAVGSHDTAPDLHRHADGTLAVAFSAVVLEPATAGTTAQRPIGVVVSERAPQHWLYPVLTGDPTFTNTGEAMLVRPERDGVILISPLRKRPTPPLTTRSTTSPEVLAALATRSPDPYFLEYRDYSGADVLSAVQHVPGTTWAVIVKVDEREALEAYRTRLWSAATTAAAVALAFGALADRVSRRRRRRLQEAVAASEARFALLLEHANDAILFVAPDGRIRDVNGRAAQMYGHPREVLLGMTVIGLRAPGARAQTGDDLRTVLASDGHIFETLHLRSDGTTFPVEVSSCRVSQRGESLILSIVRDVSERHAAAAAIERLGRLRRTLADVHRCIVRETDGRRLLEEACRVLVENRELPLAWVGRPDPASGRVVPVAVAGEAREYVDGIEVRVDDSPLGHGPTGEAWRSGQPVVVDDTARDPRVAPWQIRQRAHDFRSAAVFPIHVAGAVSAVLCVYAARSHAFGEDEAGLLQGLADDLGHALQALDQRERLRRTTETLQALFDQSPAAVYATDLEDRVTMWNRGAERLFGWRAGEVIGKPLPVVPDPDRAVFEAVRERILRGETINGLEATHQRRDRSVVEVSLSTSRLTDATGHPSGCVTIATDITQQKRAAATERALVAERDRLLGRLQLQFERMPVAFVLTDPGFRVLEWNPAAEGMFGYARAQAIGRPLVELIVPPHARGAHAAVAARLAGGRDTARVVLESHTRDGRRLQCEWFETPLFDNDGAFVAVMAMAVDITEATQSAEEVRRLNADLERRVAERTAQLEAANRELEAFSYSVSHDLRAPLRAIDGFSRMLEEDHGATLEDEGRRLLGVVRDNANRMAQLIDDLLAFSRAGRGELRRVRVDVGRLARAAFEDVVRPEERGRYRFRVDDVPEAFGDPSLLRQVLANLVSNAVKFSAPRPEPQIRVGYDATPHGGAYVVRDNGVGFDDRYADKLFGVFQRLHGDREFEGTGVGLALADRIVRRHGGRIWAASTAGDGATFWFTLPDAPPDSTT